MQQNNQGAGTGGNTKQSGLSWSQPSSNQAGQSTSGSSVNASTSQSATVQTKNASATIKPGDIDASGSASRLIGSFIAGVIVGGLLTGAFFAWRSEGTPGVQTTTSTSTTTATGENTQTGIVTGNGGTQAGSASKPSSSPATVSVSVPTQGPGMSVQIMNAQVSAPTWLIVYESVNGQPGNALGATMFFPQYNGKGGAVSLLRPTTAGKTYFVSARVDDGDHVFEPEQDAVVLDAGGSRYWTRFNVQ